MDTVNMIHEIHIYNIILSIDNITPARNSLLPTLHVRDRVHCLFISSIHTPQCLFASYSRSEKQTVIMH